MGFWINNLIYILEPKGERGRSVGLFYCLILPSLCLITTSYFLRLIFSPQDYSIYN